VAKKNPIPKTSQQRTFARQFRKADWAEMCKSPSFLHAVEYDIKRAEAIAYEMLRGTWEETNENTLL
jgi:hypothetical protein